LLFAFRGLFVHPKRDRLFANLERFGYELANKLYPPGGRDNAVMLQVAAKLENVVAAIEIHSGKLASAATESVSLGQVFKTAVTSLENASSGFEKSFGAEGAASKGLKALREVFIKFEKSVRDERKQREGSESGWAAALQKIATHGEGQAKFSSEVERIVSTLKAEQDSMMKDREETMGKVKLITDSLANMVKDLESGLKRANSEALSEFSKAVNGALQKVTESTNHVPAKIAEATLTLESKAVEAQRSIGEAKLSLDRKLGETQSSIREAHTVALGQVKEAVEACCKATDETALQSRKLGEEMKSSLTSTLEVVQMMASAVQSVNDQMRTFPRKSSSQVTPDQKRSIWQTVKTRVASFTQRD
jgi:uncharacterized FlaG/YvyC family protein